MRKNLDKLLSIFSDTPLPFSLPDNPQEWANHIRANPEQFGITKETADSMSDEKLIQEFLWNPNLFPKPKAITENGSVEWEMPQQS